jgi:hypothetical protein
VKTPIGRIIKRVIIGLLVFAILAIVLGSLALRAPVKNSLMGTYTPPRGRADIGPYSSARWFLHDAHAAQLRVDLAWYQRVKGLPAKSVSQLDASGFRPFVFVDETGGVVDVQNAGPVKTPFGLAIVGAEGTSCGYVSRRSMQNESLLNKKWMEPQEETVKVDSKADTSIHGQFLSGSQSFADQYACFMADAWDAAVARYVAIYHKPPSSLNECLDGMGLKPNPSCVWPAGIGGGVSCDGGVIDGKIVYWRVTLSDGSARGQARYYDTYNQSFDDPATPPNITTSSGSTPVADPADIGGRRDVIFTLGAMRDLIAGAKASVKAAGKADSTGEEKSSG